MKNHLLRLLIVVFVFTPLSNVHAAINSLNGLSALDQFLVTPGSSATNTMHMEIVPVNTDKHRFRWDGTPWRIDQGGSGLSTIPLLGQLLIGNGAGGYSLVATSSLGIATTGSPGGTDTQVQFNDGGVLGGDPSFTFERRESPIHSTLSVPQLWNDGPGENLSILADDAVVIDAVNGPVVIRAGSQNIGLSSNGGSAIAYFNTDNQTLDRIFHTPDQDGTFALLEGSHVWSGENTFSISSSGTTTVNFGAVGDAGSHSCFNTKNTDGDDISFYFVGTGMVIESNNCR